MDKKGSIINDNKMERWIPIPSEDYGLKMEICMIHFEETLHRMTTGKWSEENNRKKYVGILYYCLYHHVITKDHLHASGLSDCSTPEHCYRLLRRLCDRGLLLSASRSMGGTDCSVFFLSTSGLECCIKEMASMSTRYSLPITEEDLTYLGSRSQNWRLKPSLSHYLAIRDINAYLIGNRFVRPGYRCLIEADIDCTGTLVPLRERFRKIDADGFQKPGYIRADAVLLIPGKEHLFYFYLEQDTGSQRSGTVARKIEAYISNVLGAREDKYLHSVLFSILTAPAPARMKKDALSLPASIHHYIAPLPCLCYFLQISMDESGSLGRLMKHFSEYADTSGQGALQESLYARNIMNALEIVLRQHPDSSVSEFLSIYRAQSDELSRKKSEALTVVRLQSYLSRRKLLAGAVMSLKNIKDIFLEGFSVFFSPNADHGSVMPYLIPELFQGSFLVHALFQRLGNKAKEYELRYRPSSDTYRQDGYILKNEYLAPDGTAVYIENLSDDIGGPVRVREYLDQLKWSGHAGYLLCLMDNMAGQMQDQINELLKDSTYLTLSAQGGKAPLQILFVSYSDFGRRSGFFMLDNEGISPLYATYR